MSFINKPLGWLIRNIAELLGGNFAAAVAIFTLIINILLIPLSIKSQKSSVQQTRIKPKLDDLKKRCGDDKQKYNEGMQRLYQEEGVSMSGGCLPMIVRLVLMFSIYGIIMSPLTYMSRVDKSHVTAVSTAINESLAEINKKDEKAYKEYKKELNWEEKNTRNELAVINIIKEHPEALEELLSEKEYKKIKPSIEEIKSKDNVDYTLFTEKLNLTESPKFSFDIFHKAQLIWILPIMSFLAQMLSSVLSMRMQKKLNPEAPSMSGMMITMPLISLFIGFGFPGGVTFYWTCSSLIGGFIQLGVQHFYGPHKMLSRERSKELSKQCDFEAGQIKKLSSSTEEK
ncbi:MAG: membrane protein insertase YidC [Clostridia bacterium]|nr:YidC/Oxa1 family membrane protein insertase [Oscillospiraceae bacterium]MBP3600018.1 membrane protein insertase YidC [Clostridia bacterium]